MSQDIFLFFFINFHCLGQLVGNCPQGTFKCGNNHCINNTFVCDRQNDCGDNSDEEKCELSQCSYDICSQECFVKKNVVHCRCAPGYVLLPSDNKTCHASGEYTLDSFRFKFYSVFFMNIENKNHI